MTDWRDRTALLLGRGGVDRLAEASVAVFGLGGVGSFAAEALARAGIGRLVLVDGDVVDVTNLNRHCGTTQSGGDGPADRGHQSGLPGGDP